MSVPLSSHHSTLSHPTIDSTGLLIVATASSVSFFATLFLLLYVGLLTIFSKQMPGCTWASARLVFMQTSFGPLFLNLVFADMLLAIGMMHDFINYHELFTATPSVTCTSQGVLIQLADVASALLNLLIAIETFIILSNGPMLSWYTQFSMVGIWMLSSCFAVLGFLSFSSLELHAFYNWNGAWCWISSDYFTYQITFHDIWIWLTAAGSTSLYGTLFWKIRTHYKGEGHILRRSSIVLPPPSTPSTISTITGSQSTLSSNPKRQRVGKKGLKVVARTMLLYPISFVAYSIPLTVVSLLENRRRSSSNSVAMIIFSTIFALRGAIDVLAFGMTRNVFILRTPPAPACEEDTLSPSSPGSIQKSQQLSSVFEKLGEEKDLIRPQIDPYDTHKTIDLKLPARRN